MGRQTLEQPELWYNPAMGFRAVKIIRPGWFASPLIRRGWQHDGREAMNPNNPPSFPQKIPEG